MKINFGKKTIIAGAVISSLLAVVLLANAVLAATTTWTVSDANLKVSGSTTCFPIFSYVLGLQQGATYGRGTGGTFQQNKAGASTIVADLEQSSSGQGLSDTQALNGDLGLSSSINSALLPLPVRRCTSWKPSKRSPMKDRVLIAIAAVGRSSTSILSRPTVGGPGSRLAPLQQASGLFMPCPCTCETTPSGRSTSSEPAKAQWTKTM